MARIIQQKIFRWKDVEASGELERLTMMIEAIPDDELMEALERERGCRYDDPLRPLFMPFNITELPFTVGEVISLPLHPYCFSQRTPPYLS